MIVGNFTNTQGPKIIEVESQNLFIVIGLDLNGKGSKAVYSVKDGVVTMESNEPLSFKVKMRSETQLELGTSIGAFTSVYYWVMQI